MTDSARLVRPAPLKLSAFRVSDVPGRALTRPSQAPYNQTSMPISALIIDDEQLARDELKYLLDQVGDVDVVALGANGIEAVVAH